MKSSRWTQTIKPTINQFLPQSVYGKTFLIITILESCIDVILESVVIARLNLIHTFKLSFDSAATKTPLAVYLGIFILAHLFQLYFALDALRHKNTIQLIGLCCFNFAFLVYAIIQVPEIRKIESVEGSNNTNSNLTPAIILSIIPACIGISQVAFVYLTWHLFKEFGWQIYKQIGADRKIKRVYLWYQIFMCLLKFDYFFFMAFTVQLVLLVPSVSPLERVLTIIALPTTFLFLVIGYYGVRKEIKSVTCLFMLGLLSGSCYFVYKLFRIWQGRSNVLSYANVFKSLTVFSVSCLLMTLLSFTSAIICLLNFGKGLKPQIDKTSSTRKKPSERRRQAERVYGNTGEGRRQHDEQGGERYSRKGSGTTLGTMTKQGGLEVYMDGGMEQQKLSTFKSNNHQHGFLEDPVGGYFSSHLDFDDDQLRSSPPTLPPPPFELSAPNHHLLNLSFPQSTATPTTTLSQARTTHQPHGFLHSHSQRRQNSASINDDSQKRMSID
ncbi:hypothetical protein PGT21_037175 [Puccinia graminis f. sp. tritici]|uniref:Uncharacterized protein n=1 Tax=Puccinia graminis f. sp. tritici TaxID=56615 RepID=A0A5B0R3U6_PUCGR|nr:hypothetical protein PGT21_037175 [Puccinia graminis f. sp. tritici]